MQPNDNVIRMFNTEFEKPAAEVMVRVNKKVAQIMQKIEERQARIAKIRAEYGIDDAALIELYQKARAASKRSEAAMSYAYTSNARVGAQGPTEATISAGVVNNLLTESDFIDSEREQVKRLGLFARNVIDTPNYDIRSYNGPESERPKRGVMLNYEELEFLGY